MPQSHAEPSPVGVQEIVNPNPEVEEVSWSDSRRVRHIDHLHGFCVAGVTATDSLIASGALLPSGVA
jgi:hypothetical protein